MRTSVFTAALAAVVGAFSSGTSAASNSHLPVFFFHGATGNHSNGINIEKNLTAEGRTYVALDFCEVACSVKTSIATQIDMAIAQIEGIISKDAKTYANGYHFLAHSQGGSVARGVIEEWDSHKVHTFISMAGDGNGNFYGPQASDQVPLQVLLQALGPFAIDESDFNFTKYLDDSSTWSGKFQRDFIETAVTDAELHTKSSILNTMRPPLSDAALANWLKIDSFLPKVNNLEACGANATCRSEQARRKANFVKLQAAHFFASPQDDIQVPWQTSVLGLYSTVATVDAIETKFKNFTVVDMKQTKEYKSDLYGLKTLDSAKKLFTHAVAGVPHNCWLFDYTSLATDVLCHHDPVYAANIYPLLV